MNLELRFILSQVDKNFLVRDSNRFGGRGLFTKAKVKKNEIFHRCQNYLIVPQPTFQSIEFGHRFHLIDNVIANINHSCVANTVAIPEKKILIALRDIDEGEEVTLFYPASEIELCQPFDCRCDEANCLKQIRGSGFIIPNRKTVANFNRRSATFKGEVL